MFWEEADTQDRDPRDLSQFEIGEEIGLDLSRVTLNDNATGKTFLGI
jgi:hypothetical protein